MPPGPASAIPSPKTAAAFQDPKLAYALRNPHLFPVDINKAPYEIILRVPGIGVRSAKLDQQARAVDQDHYSQLWKAYYDAINIMERQNHRQMKRAMPQRYWKYLPEKGE